MKIAVFGLVGETLNTNGYYFEPRRGALLEIDRYLPACHTYVWRVMWRENGKLLERLILGLGNFRRILARSDRETLGDRPFCRCMDGLSLTWRNDGC